jgi:gliding motility-associated lipoprotein GldH
MTTYSKIAVTLLLSLLLFSCDSNIVFEKYIEVENAIWIKENVADFGFDIQDTVNAHNIYINIRNTGDYPYSNLYLFVTIKGPDGSFSVDTVNCILADNRGKWKGKGVGDLWDLKIPYIGQFKFAQQGKYTVSYEQAMRVENGLKGITDVGLRVEKSEK